MRYARVFPTILIGLQICAAVIYLVGRDWRRGIYWLAAAVLNACVTY